MIFKESEVKSNSKLYGKNIVVTGTFSFGSRDKLIESITVAGGKVVSSVSKKTDYLFAGEKAGSKLKKAQDLGIAIINEEKIKEILEVWNEHWY